MLELVRAVQSIIEGTGMRGDTIAGTQLRPNNQLRPIENLSDNEKRYKSINILILAFYFLKRGMT